MLVLPEKMLKRVNKALKGYYKLLYKDNITLFKWSEHMRRFKHLDYSKRQQIERMLKKKYSVKEIAACLDVALNTIYLELKRGACEQLNYELEKKVRYSADLAEYKYRCNLKNKGKTPKVVLDKKLNRYIKEMIKEQRYSPEAVIYTIRNNSLNFKHNVTSYTTIYTAIKRGNIKGLKAHDLPRGEGYRKRIIKDRTRKQEAAGTSIELRPVDILTREEFGHWEMDCVIGKNTNRKTLLVFTERKTRMEIIEKLKAHTTDEVVKALNRIEKRYYSSFYKIFKTITVDNGMEFKNSKGMEKALYRVGSRTKVYFCHPNSPNERGSNENCNLLIRRFLPKGSNFDKCITRKKVKEIENWINTYPRGIHGGRCAEELFIEELAKLDIDYYYLC